MECASVQESNLLLLGGFFSKPVIVANYLPSRCQLGNQARRISIAQEAA